MGEHVAKILVVGAYGLLGSHLTPYLASRGHEVCAQGRSPNAQFPADPTSLSGMRALLDCTRPDVVVNLVAATNVDLCQADPYLAFSANLLPVEILNTLFSERATQLIHLSTDQVYSGPGPHREDQARPINVYALSKYAAEFPARQAQGTVLRTNFVGKSRRHDRPSFTDWLVDAFRGGKPITLFDDVSFNPVHLSTLAVLVEHFCQHPVPGVFNVGSVGYSSKAQFALEFARQLGLDASAARVGKLADVPLKAKRPHDMSMATQRLAETVPTFTLPSIAQTITLACEDYANERGD
jgi:dTDP-4-dehydrorhamnose reductase